jgi:hypothetical protein
MVYPQFATVFWLASAGFWVAYLIQRTNWYYHVLPNFSMNILLDTLLFVPLFYSTLNNKKNKMALTAWSLLVFSYIYIDIPFITHLYAPIFEYAFLILCGSLFLFLLHSQYPHAIFSMGVRFFILMMIGIVTFVRIAATYWASYQVLMTIFIMFSLFWFLLRGKNNRTQVLGVAMLGFMVYSIPVYYIAFAGSYSIDFKKLYRGMLARTQRYAGHSIYYFSTTADLAFPAVFYHHQQYASRFWNMLWIFPNLGPEDVKPFDIFYKKHQPQLTFYIHMIVEDFQQNKPDLVFVDTRNKRQDGLAYYGDKQVDYINIFKYDPTFNTLWHHYKYIRTDDYPPLYRFDIYQKEL